MACGKNTHCLMMPKLSCSCHLYVCMFEYAGVCTLVRVVLVNFSQRGLIIKSMRLYILGVLPCLSPCRLSTVTSPSAQTVDEMAYIQRQLSSCFLLKLGQKTKKQNCMPTTPSVTSVTAMHSVPDEKKHKQKTSNSISLYKNNMVCCVMNSHAVALEFGTAEFYWGVIFVLKQS